MNLKSLKQKALVAAVIGAFAQPALANECDTGAGVNSWGAWCDVTAFLSQQEPTAAGGNLSSFQAGVSARNFESDSFGGAVQNEENASFVGYVLVKVRDAKQSFMGKVALVNDEDNEAVYAKIFVDVDGREQSVDITLDDYKQYIKGAAKGVRAHTSKQSYATDTDRTPEDQIHATVFLNNVSFGEDSPIYEDDVAYGTMYLGSPFAHFSGVGYVGTPTSVADMNNLKNIQASTNYSIHGQTTLNNYKNGNYKEGYLHGNMAVNFGQGTFTTTQVHSKYSENKKERFNLTVNATGNVTGNSFKSNGISIESHTVTGGSINGVFTGSQAKNVVGQTNIQFNRTKNGNMKELKSVFSSNGGPG